MVIGVIGSILYIKGYFTGFRTARALSNLTAFNDAICTYKFIYLKHVKQSYLDTGLKKYWID